MPGCGAAASAYAPRASGKQGVVAAAALLPATSGPGAAAWLLRGFVLTLAVLAPGKFLGFRTAAGIVADIRAPAVLVPVVGMPWRKSRRRRKR